MLGRGPHRNSFFVVIRDYGVRLQSVVIDHRESEMVFKNFVSLSEPFLHVTFLDMFMAADVIAEVLMNPWSFLFERTFQADDRGQLFVIDPDQGESLGCSGFVHRSDGGDRFSLV